MYLKAAKGTRRKDLQIFDHGTDHGDHQGDAGLQKLPNTILSQFPEVGLGHYARQFNGQATKLYST